MLFRRISYHFLIAWAFVRRFCIILIPFSLIIVLWGAIVFGAKETSACVLAKDGVDVVEIVSAALVFASAWVAVRCFEGALISKHFEDYSKPEMAEYLRTLSMMRIRQYKLFRLHRTPFNTTPNPMGSSLSELIEQSKNEEIARRALKFYFLKALDLYKSGRISRSSFRRLVDQSAICLFFDVVEPVEASLDPIYEATAYHEIMLLAGDIYLKHKLFDAAVTIERVLQSNYTQMGDKDKSEEREDKDE